MFGVRALGRSSALLAKARTPNREVAWIEKCAILFARLKGRFEILS
jgi:hypothetical protein